MFNDLVSHIVFFLVRRKLFTKLDETKGNLTGELHTSSKKTVPFGVLITQYGLSYSGHGRTENATFPQFSTNIEILNIARLRPAYPRL